MYAYGMVHVETISPKSEKAQKQAKRSMYIDTHFGYFRDLVHFYYPAFWAYERAGRALKQFERLLNEDSLPSRLAMGMITRVTMI